MVVFNFSNRAGMATVLVISEGPWCLTTGAAYDIFWADDWGDGGLSFNVIVDGVASAQFVGDVGVTERDVHFPGATAPGP